MGCTNCACISKAAGVKNLRRSYTGSVSVRNDINENIKIRFAEPNLLGSTILHAEVAPGDIYVFDPGPSWNFDFHATVGDNKVRSHMVRGAIYAVRKDEDVWNIETLTRPDREQSLKLSNLKGLSLSFSASGWLVIYQLGAAECLQNHGLFVWRSANVSLHLSLFFVVLLFFPVDLDFSASMASNTCRSCEESLCSCLWCLWWCVDGLPSDVWSGCPEGRGCSSPMCCKVTSATRKGIFAEKVCFAGLAAMKTSVITPMRPS